MLLGLLITNALSISLSFVGAVVFSVLCLPALRSRRWWTLLVAVCIGLVIGGARGSDYSSEVSRYDKYRGKQVTLTGVLATDPQQSVPKMMIFQLNEVVINNEKVPGEIRVTAPTEVALKRGDEVKLQGTLREGFASFYGSLSHATVLSITRKPDVVRDIREQFSNSVHRFVSEPMASLGIGFVVGQRTTLPQELDTQLKMVGLTHIVVASGYNLTILVRFARRVLARHSRYLAFVVSIILMLSFVAFSGLSPSMNRAVAVTGLSLLAWYYGRRFHPLLLILYVAAATAVWNPMYVWSDLGWYLSFFAFAGVLIIAPLLCTILFRTMRPPALGQLVIETLSAELMTLPIIALAFGTFPVFSLLANVLVGPVIPFAMLATTIAGVAGMLVPAIAPILALPATVIIGYVIALVEWLSSIEWAQLDISLTMPLTILWFAGLLVGAIIIWRRTNYNFRSASITD